MTLVSITDMRRGRMGLSTRIALKQIFAPFGSDDPAELAYAAGDRIHEDDVEALLDLDYDLPEMANENPDTIRQAIANARAKEQGGEAVEYDGSPEIPKSGTMGKDHAEITVAEAHPDRYADGSEGEGKESGDSAAAPQEAAEKAVDGPEEDKAVPAPSKKTRKPRVSRKPPESK